MKPLIWMRHIRDSDLPGTLRTTAWAIGLRADMHGQCWPTYQQLADDCGVDRRRTIRHVKQLREAGWLMVAGRSNGHGTQANSYLLITPAGGDTRTTPPVTPGPPPSDTRTTPQGVTPGPPRSVTPNEVSETPPLDPVHNPHLAAVVNLVSRQHRLPH